MAQYSQRTVHNNGRLVRKPLYITAGPNGGVRVQSAGAAHHRSFTDAEWRQVMANRVADPYDVYGTKAVLAQFAPDIRAHWARHATMRQRTLPPVVAEAVQANVARWQAARQRER